MPAHAPGRMPGALRDEMSAGRVAGQSQPAHPSAHPLTAWAYPGNRVVADMG